MRALKSFVVFSVISLSMASCARHQVSFSRDVNPILQKNCSICHSKDGPGSMKSGFSVATYKDVMKGTKYGSVISPGSSVGSTLVRLIKHQADPTINMPKEYSLALKNHDQKIMVSNGARSLSKHDISLISDWVDQGAKNN